jgi:hypothetical protein
MVALLVRLSLYIIEIASALTLLFLALGWALRHVGDALLSLAVDIANLRAKFRSVKKKRSVETRLITPERGLSGR